MRFMYLRDTESSEKSTSRFCKNVYDLMPFLSFETEAIRHPEHPLTVTQFILTHGFILLVFR